MAGTIEKLYLKPREIVELTGVRIDTVMNWIHTGEIKAYNTAENPNGQRPRWRIATADLEAFLQNRSNKTPEKPIRPARRQRKSKPTRQWV